jgi:trimeric autotransporter adhesin
MQTWAKRGLQTALVTGGLLMLGTGIASADEDVNPDAPPSPMDGSVTVPVHLDNNAVGEPLGSKTVPGVHKDVSVRASDATGKLPTGRVAPVAGPATDKVRQTAPDVAAPAIDKVQNEASSIAPGSRDQAAPVMDRTKPVTDRLGMLPGGDKLGNAPSIEDKVRVPAIDARHGQVVSGNSINVDLVVPVDFSGNAIAILGKAETSGNDSSQQYGSNHDVTADGSSGVISGNVVDVDWVLPVQFTNNAIAAAGKASAAGTSSQETAATGDIDTKGDHGVLSGNVVAPQGATPVQFTGNAISGIGFAEASSTSDTSAQSGGSILTSGQDSVGGGNAVPVPVAVPVKGNGNAIMALGRSVAESYSTADAQAGSTRTGMYGVPTYVETNGDPALAAGNIAQPAASGPVSLCGNAGGAGGNADATCETNSTTAAGGASRSTGAGSIASGTIASAPVALPTSGFGNAPVAVGNGTADATNINDASAGGDSYTRGHDSIVSGTTANATPAGPVDIFANPVAAVGNAATTTQNTSETTSGGNTGTTGDNSVGGGNQGTVPVAVPGEIYGNAAAVAGGAEGVISEDKKVVSGGGSNTDDDNGLAASNLVNAPVATAAQVFGNGAGAVAFTKTHAESIDEVTAGGPSKATGTAGLGSGNIAQTPVSQPFQFFGNGVSGLANGKQSSVNELDSQSGGDATSDGTHGVVGGNVVSVPAGGAAQLFGESVASLGHNKGLSGSMTNSEAGGDTATSGESGLASGNVASPQAMPVVQSFAAAVSGVGGVNQTTATNESDNESGGDIDTNGDSGFISGNLVDVPAGAVVQPFGDAVSAVSSRSKASGLSETEGDVGGTSTTSGSGLGSLSGLDATVPVAANIPVYDVPVEVLAQAIADSSNASAIEVGEGGPQINLPVSGGIAPTEVPSFIRGARAMSDDPVQGMFSGVLTGFANGMTGAPGQPQVSGVSSLVNEGVLAQTPAVPVPTGRTETPGVFQGEGLPINVFGAPVVGDQHDLPQTPAAPDFGHMLSPLTAVQPSHFGSFGRSNPAAPVEGAPFVGDLADITTVLPAVSGAGLPVSANLPLVQQLPGVQVPGVGSRSEGSSLDSTRAALANLFTTHPIS